MIVRGSAYAWIPADRAHRLASKVRISRVEIIEGVGHLVQEDDPDELNETLRRWLQDLAPE